ncbi:MAG: UDP-N-acetylmuramoyl-tripeptide--D-alanyl-D-alanine ligase [Saprospiraceae bacterium]
MPTTATTEELYAQFLSAPAGITTDSRRVLPGQLFWSLRGDRFDGNTYAAAALAAGAVAAVVDDPALGGQPGFLLVDDGLSALQRLATHHRRRFRMPVIAITGSNGKTTTKELIAAVMSRQYRLHFTQGNLNNHIGVPLTLLQIPADAEAAVIEMGANHQREIAELCRIVEPTHGIITNVGDAHLEGFGGREGVKKGKGELYDFLAASGGTAIVNLDDADLVTMAAQVKKQVPYLASDNPTVQVPPLEVKPIRYEPTVRVAFLDESKQLIEAETHLPGRHNFLNIMLAVVVGKYFKVPGREIVAALDAYQPTNNRSQWSEVGGIRFFLDAYNANPSSMAVSLETFARIAERPRLVILGDMLELGEAAAQAHHDIATQAAGEHETILVGKHFATAAEQLGLRHFGHVDELKEWFWKQDWTGYSVLTKGSRGIALDLLLVGRE